MLQSAPSFKDSRKPSPQGASRPVEVAEPLTSAVPSLLGEIQPYPSWSPSLMEEAEDEFTV